MIKILLFLSGTSLSASAQILLKSGVSNTASTFFSNMMSWPVFAAIICYFLSFVSYAAYLRTSDLTLAAPIFVGGVVLLLYVYGLVGGESITHIRTVGAVLIITGIFLIHASAG